MVKFFLLVILAICALAANTVAQRKAISAKEFDKAALIANAPQKSPFRNTSRVEIYFGGEVVESKISICERDMNGDGRCGSVIATANAIKRLDTVELGDYLYTKIDNGAWTKEPWYFQHPEAEIVRFYLGTDKYWKETTGKGADKVTIFGSSMDRDDGGRKGYQKVEYFFDANNIPIKKVTTYGNDITNQISRIDTLIRVHDPTIKIEAPIK